MKRWQILVAIGAGLAVSTFFLLPFAIEWWFFRSTDEKFHRVIVVYPSNRITAHAPVFLWDGDVPKDEAPWRERIALTLHVRKTGIYHEEVSVKASALRMLIDSKIIPDQREYLVVVPESSVSWLDLWKVLDESRRSNVAIVFVKYE